MRIVITWWLYSGKDDLLKEFKKKWYNLKWNVVDKNIDFLIYALGMEGYKLWIKNNYFKFQEINILKTLERDIYLKENKLYLLDGWVFDFFVDLKQRWLKLQSDLEDLTKKIYYDKIVFLNDISFLQNGVDKSKLVEFNDLLKEEYIDRFWEENVLEVPYFWEKDLNLENQLRLEFIQEELNLK